MQKRRSHLGVAIDTFIIGKTLFLDSTCLDNPFTDSQTGFGRTLFGNLLKRHGNDLHLYVDAVEQRSRNTVHVFLYRSRRTETRPVGMVVITARARIHRSDQHKAGGIIDRETGTRNRDLAILQRLTHHFEHTPVELRQLIEKQYPIMSQADLSRLRISSPAYHRHIRNGMMRRAERTLYHQGSLHPYLSCYRMDLRCLQRFMQGERRKNSRQPFCQHRLAASRCTYHQ